jgi:hypothetical protein
MQRLLLLWDLDDDERRRTQGLETAFVYSSTYIICNKEGFWCHMMLVYISPSSSAGWRSDVKSRADGSMSFQVMWDKR